MSGSRVKFAVCERRCRSFKGTHYKYFALSGNLRAVTYSKMTCEILTHGDSFKGTHYKYFALSGNMRAIKQSKMTCEIWHPVTIVLTAKCIRVQRKKGNIQDVQRELSVTSIVSCTQCNKIDDDVQYLVWLGVTYCKLYTNDAATFWNCR